MRNSLSFKRITILILFSLVLMFGVFGFAYAQDNYTTITNFGSADNPNFEQINTLEPNAYFERLFVIFIVVSGALAVVRLMICGIQYMTSESVSTKGAAKTCIAWVIGGLFLILLSFIILNTINPNLTALDLDTLGGQLQGQIEGVAADHGGVSGANPDDTFCLLGPFGCDDPSGECGYFDLTCIDRSEEQNQYCFSNRTRTGTVGSSCYPGKEACENARENFFEALGPCTVQSEFVPAN